MKLTKDRKELSKKVENIVKSIYGIVDWALETEQNLDRVINDTYSLIRERFKENRGSRSNLTGIIEYMYVYLFKKEIEDQMNIHFEKVKTNAKHGDHVYYFKYNLTEHNKRFEYCLYN